MAANTHEKYVENNNNNTNKIDCIQNGKENSELPYTRYTEHKKLTDSHTYTPSTDRRTVP